MAFIPISINILLVRVQDGHPFKLMPKESGLLLMLVKQSGRIVSYDELKETVWSETSQVMVHTIRETKHTLAKILGDSSSKLETIAGKGYRFNIEATEGGNIVTSDDSIDTYL